MRIFNSPTGDPMLFETSAGLGVLHASLQAFLTSDSQEVSFPASTAGSPAPYLEFLCGLRVRLSNASLLTLSPDRWLELSGPPEALESFSARLLACPLGSHTHWYCSPLSLIIEEGNVEAEALET